MALAFVQQIGTAVSKTSGANLTITVPAGGVAAHHTIIVAVGSGAGTPSEGAVSDSAGNTYRRAYLDLSGSGSPPNLAVYLCDDSAALSSGNTIVVSGSGMTSDHEAFAIDISGTSLKAVFDGLQNAPSLNGRILGSSATNSATPAITSKVSTWPDSMVIGIFCFEGPGGDSWSGTHNTIAGVGTTGSGAASNTSIRGDYRIESAVGTFSVGGTNGNARNVTGVALTFVGLTSESTNGPTFRSVANNSGGNTTSVTVTRPSGAAVGDILLAGIVWGTSGSQQHTDPPGGSGWTLVKRLNQSGEQEQAELWWKPAESGDPSTWTFTISGSPGDHWASACAAYQNADLTTPFGSAFDGAWGQGAVVDGWEGTESNNATPALTDRSTVAPTSPETRLVIVGGVGGTGISWLSRPANFNERLAASHIRLDDFGLATARAFGLHVQQSTAGNEARVGIIAALRKNPTVTQTFTANAVLRKTQTTSFTADAIKRRTTTAALTADAVKRKTTTGSITVDAVIAVAGSQTSSFTANAVLRRTQTGSFTADAVKRRTQSSSLTANAVLKAARSASLTADAVKRRTQSASFTADAVLAAASTRTGSFTANAVLRRAQSASLTADAVLRKTTSVALTADAVKRKTITGSITVDASINKVVTGSLTASAVIKAQQTAAVTARAFIVNGESGPDPVTGAGDVHIRVNGVDITDDVIIKTARFTMLVNGAVGSFYMQVKDTDRTRNFTSGSEVTLDINGKRRFGGYATQPKRSFAFEVVDTSNIPKVTRIIVLEGPDYNILFQKRVVYDKANPANVNLRSWPADSLDTDVIKYVFDHYTDLGADGITYDGVTHVGTPNPDRRGVIASGGLYFGDAMREINRLINGVWYISPYKDLNYVDVDTPTASKSFSDRPSGGTEIGYREFEHAENGTGLVNEAFIWGAGQGSTRIAFAKAKDADSIAAHGLWQFGEFTAALYKQASVQKRADSLVFGSPQSKRGGKDDQVSWTVATFDQAFSVGEKVTIESEIWGISDVVPIRRMTVTFPTKTHPRFDLVLSHEIDEPWNMFEFYFPKFNFRIPPIDLPGGDQTGCTKIDDFDRTVELGWGASPIKTDTTATEGHYWIGQFDGSEEAASVNPTDGGVIGPYASEYNLRLPFTPGIMDYPVETLMKMDLGAGVGDLAPGVTIECNSRFATVPTSPDVVQDAVLTRVDSNTINVELFGNGYADNDNIDVDLTYLSNDVWIRRYVDYDINAFKIWNDGDTEPVDWTITLPGAPIDFLPPSQFGFYYGGVDHGGAGGGTAHLRYFEIVGSYECGMWAGAITRKSYVFDPGVNHSGDPSWHQARVALYSETHYSKADNSVLSHSNRTTGSLLWPQEIWSDITASGLGNPIHNPVFYYVIRGFIRLFGVSFIRARVDYLPENSMGVPMEQTPFGSTNQNANEPVIGMWNLPITGPTVDTDPVETFDAGVWINLAVRGGMLQIAPFGAIPWTTEGFEGEVGFRTLVGETGDTHPRAYATDQPGTDAFVISIDSVEEAVWVPNFTLTAGTVSETLPFVDGTTYQLDAPYVAGSTQVWVDGLFQRPGIEYTESDPDLGQIEFASPLLSTNVVQCVYEANGGF